MNPEYLKNAVIDILSGLSLKERKDMLEELGTWLNIRIANDYKAYDKVQKAVIANLRDENERLSEENKAANNKYLTMLAKYNALFVNTDFLRNGDIKIEDLDTDKIILANTCAMQKKHLAEANKHIKKYKDKCAELHNAIARLNKAANNIL